MRQHENRVENGKAARLPVNVGIRAGNVVEVLKKQTKPPKAGEDGLWEEISGQKHIVLANSRSVMGGGKRWLWLGAGNNRGRSETHYSPISINCW
jgi:hypothetical protein